jgi:dipeptidyl aminopeptidase/acylaminoacyl peptidase
MIRPRRLLAPLFFAVILGGISSVSPGARPKESVRDELIRRQSGTGLTLAAYYLANLNVVLFSSRSLAETGEHVGDPQSKWVSDKAISPDGQEVAFRLDGFQAASTFAISRLDGSSRRDYSEIAMPSEMCWSYDRSKLLLSVRDSSPDRTTLRLMDVTSKAIRDLDSGAYVYLTPQCWSPDGKYVAYETQDPIHRKKDGSGEIINPTVKLYDFDRNESRRLAKGSAPTWSPDGKHIAFLDHDSYFVIAPDGSARTTLFHEDAVHSGLIWSPDCQLVAFLSRNHLFEPPILLDVGPVRLRVRRLSDGSADWVAQLTDVYLPKFQWVETKDLISRAQSKRSPK